MLSLWLRIKAAVLHRKLNRDIDEEVEFHLAMREEEFGSAGAARRRFGNPVLHRETMRGVWTFAWLDALARDLRYAVRISVRSPVFTAVALGTLAFGIGANTAIFSVVNGVLLRQMPYDRPEDVYAIREAVRMGSARYPSMPVNGGNFVEWKRSSRAFADLALLRPENDDIRTRRGTWKIHGLRASACLFPMLGIHPLLGRAFTPSGDEFNTPSEMILTFDLWRNRFGGDPGVVGRTVFVNGYPSTIVGILPRSFYFPKQEQLYGAPIAGWTYGVEYFINLSLGPWDRKAAIGNFNFAALGRVKPGVTREQAAADLNIIEARIASKDISGAHLYAEVIPMRSSVVGSTDRSLWIFMAGSGLVLLIVCVNMAGLLMGRNAGRVREISIRSALGASRGTLLRQFAAEGLLLAAIGGGIEIVAAVWGVRLLVRSAPITLPRLESVTVDGPVLLFGIGIALVSGLTFSMLPAMLPAIRSRSFVHNLLAGSEITFCTVLLICALLLGQSLNRVLQDNAWLNVDRVLTFEVSASPKNYQESPARAQLYETLLQNLSRIPGVSGSGFVNALPLRGMMWASTMDVAEIPMTQATSPVANFRFTSPGYAEAIGLPLAAGRTLQASDAGHRVILISQSLARRYPGRNLVGMHMKWAGPDNPKPLSLEIVGVLSDVRAEAEGEPSLAVYIPYWVYPPWEGSLVVRTANDPQGVIASVQRMIRRTEPLMTPPRGETLHEILNTSVASRRFYTSLGTVFAVSAVTLAALGLYGVVSLAFARRRKEIGIRMALGATRKEVFRMVIGQSTRLAFAGVAVGLLLGASLTRLIRSLLYEVRPTDPVLFAAAGMLVIAVAMTASFFPARRAATVDPMTTLKYE